MYDDRVKKLARGLSLAVLFLCGATGVAHTQTLSSPKISSRHVPLLLPMELQDAPAGNRSGSVTPQMFGARADGHADDTVAIQKAIDSGNSVYFPEGIYLVGGHITPGANGNYLENRILTLHSNLAITGSGKRSVLLLKDHLLDGVDDKTSNAHMMGGYDLENVSISGLQFFMNGAHNLTPPGKIRNAMAIFIMGGKNVSIEHNFFYNCAGRNVISMRRNEGSGATISNNEFRNGGHYVGTPVENVNNTDFSFVYTEWTNSAVDNNWIEEDDLQIGLNTKGRGPGGIELHGSGSHAIGNTIVGTMPAIYVAASPHPVSNIEVRNNTIRNAIEGIRIIPYEGTIVNAQILNNSISVTQTKAGDAGPCYGILFSGGNSQFFDKPHGNSAFLQETTITGNSITNAFPLGKTWLCGGISLHSLHGAEISNNEITSMTGTGLTLLGSPWGSLNVNIRENRILDCGSEAPIPFKTGIFFNQAGQSRVPPQPFRAENILIEKNTLGNSNSTGAENSGITLAALQDSHLQNVTISGNIFLNVKYQLFDGHVDLTQPQALNPQVRYQR